MPTRSTLEMMAVAGFLVATIIGLSGFTKMGVIFSGTRIADGTKKWKLLLAATLVINLFALVAVPVLTCSCHFWPKSFYVSLIPFLWGLLLLVCYSNKAVRDVAYLAIAFSMLWVILSATINPWPILSDTTGFRK